MSIAARHNYRFNYLKSDEWKSVRTEALVRDKCECGICGEPSESNDAHHMWYPENIYETTVDHLVILCRGCHEFVHAMLPECKTSDREIGMRHWHDFLAALQRWMSSKFDRQEYIKLSIRQHRKRQEFDRYMARIEADPRLSNEINPTVCIHISDSLNSETNSTFTCHTKFNIRHHFGLLSSIPESRRDFPSKPVSAFWESKREILGIPQLRDKHILMISAGDAHKALSDRVSLPTEIAASTFLSCLPADWPCFLSIPVGIKKIDNLKMNPVKTSAVDKDRLGRYLKRLKEKPTGRLKPREKKLLAMFPDGNPYNKIEPLITPSLRQTLPAGSSPA